MAGIAPKYQVDNEDRPLSDLEVLRYAEIVDVLSIPEGTVKSRLFWGRRLLQRRLARYAVETGYIRLQSAVG